MNQKIRLHRRHRIRARIVGTGQRPRASVFRSARAISVQLIDDTTGHTVAAVSGRPKKKQNKTAQARSVGTEMAKQAATLGIKKIVFDRAGYHYHGRVKALAEAMRAGGLVF